SMPFRRSLKAEATAWARSVRTLELLVMVAPPAVLLLRNITKPPRFALAGLLVILAWPAVLLSRNSSEPSAAVSALTVMVAFAAVLAFWNTVPPPGTMLMVAVPAWLDPWKAARPPDELVMVAPAAVLPSWKMT